jgi:hypothetical protein
MVPTSPRLIIIARPRPFDEAVWKRLLIAYAYALYDQRGARDKTAEATGESAK